MKSVFSEFSKLWPASGHAALSPLLSKISFFYYPSEKAQILTAKDPQSSIVIFTEGSIKDIIQIAALGFEHCVQMNRPDFAQELLASALMVSRPDSFVKNPIPFFFTGFSPNGANSTETNMSLAFRRTTDKSYLLERLQTFLGQNPRLQGISDLCIQVADELISNALFSSPVDTNGNSLYQGINRNTEIHLPEGKDATFFSCFSDYRVVVGCEDQFGSFRKNLLMDHLENSFLREKASAREGQSGGAGLGFRYIIENSANFYLYCDRGKRSLVAAGFLLKGLKSNMTADKHFHMGFK